MTDIKKTIAEAQEIISLLKTMADSGTALTGNDKSDMEVRINHLMNVSEPEFNGNKLDIGLLDLRDNIDNQIKNQDDKVAQLSSEVSEKNATIAQQVEQIKDLQALTGKLDNISQDLDKIEGKSDNSSELSDLKNNVGGVDRITNDIKAQTEKLTTENKQIHQDLVKTKTIAYLTGTTSGVSFLGLIWLIFKDTFKQWFARKVDQGISEIQIKVQKEIKKV